jgi:SOS-response transcriptional repressor LexA
MRLGIDAQAFDSLEVEQLLINNQGYSIHTPPGSSASPEVRLNQSFILRVKGDSMNQAGIQDGDYVLLQMKQNAVHNDIVAAEITGGEYEATLKRYRLEENGRRVILQPESNNPRHKRREFYNGDNVQGRYRILGVVVAVLKPI